MAAPKGHPRYGGRKKGTPNKATVDVKAAAREYGPAAIERLVKLLEREDSPATQLGAARELLDRAYGKATQPVAGDDSLPAIRHALTVGFLGGVPKG